MMLTEKDAKKKVCHPTLGPGGFAHGENGEQNCIGSKCMAWRKASLPYAAEASPKPGDPFWLLGYCGLAGKVE